MEFYFDYISPNAYLAWQPVINLARRFNEPLVLRPVLFAGLLEAHGQVGPAEVRPKMRWMVANCLRKAERDGVPLKPPHSHPFNPLLSLRLTLACEAEQRERLTNDLFRWTWAESRDVSDSAVLGKLLDAAGFDGNALLHAAATPEIKHTLREATDAAVATGVFGVPAVIAKDEIFFGYDDLPWLERHLDGAPPPDSSGWTSVRPSAWRRSK